MNGAGRTESKTIGFFARARVRLAQVFGRVPNRVSQPGADAQYQRGIDHELDRPLPKVLRLPEPTGPAARSRDAALAIRSHGIADRGRPSRISSLFRG